ncbi:MAG: BamA/TamA family outer membrane protein, partial [Ignavibacteriaceae bacterium]
MKSFILSLSIIIVLSFSLFAQEPEQYELSSINFEGNNSFPDDELKTHIQSEENPFWLWRFFYNTISFIGSPPNYFDSSSISVDLISLKSFYSVNGYFNAEINYKFTVDTASRSVALTYIIKENEMHTYGSIKTIGLDNVEGEVRSYITPYLEYPDWERYVQENVQTKNEEIIKILKNYGYMLASYDSTIVKIDTVKAKTNLSNYFTLGNWFTYSEIKIKKEGESKSEVSDNLIKYLTNINVGDQYKEDEIVKSRVRLARTGMFNTINLTGEIQDTAAGKVALLINGNVASLNELSPEVFADNENNYFNVGVGASYIRKNFLGDARKLTVRARFKVNDVSNLKFTSNFFKQNFQSQVDLSAIIEQPFLFSRRVAGRLETYLKSYNISSVDYTNYGANFTSAVDMPTYTFVNLLNPYLRFDWLNYSVPLTQVEQDTIAFNPKTFTSSLGAEIGSRNTDNLFYPTEGRTISLITEVSSAKVSYDFKNINSSEVARLIDSLGFYVKLQLTFGNYFAISRDRNTVLATKLKTGYIQMLSGGAGLIAPNQTFFAGGSNSIRGWRSRELIPSDPLFDLFPQILNETLKIRGGDILLEGSFEYRRKFAKTFGVVFFIDYGNTWNEFSEIRIDQLAVAFGPGLRYYSEIAPFRIDFGFKFYDPGDSRF